MQHGIIFGQFAGGKAANSSPRVSTTSEESPTRDHCREGLIESSTCLYPGYLMS